MRNLELEAKMMLGGVGLRGELIERYYQAIYVNPDLKAVEPRMRMIVEKIDWDQVIEIALKILALDDREILINVQEMAEYFRELMGIRESITVSEDHSISAMEMETTISWAGVEKLELHVNGSALLRCVLLDYVDAIAHEMWHAWQSTEEGAWRKGKKNPMAYLQPEEVRRGQLYYLNSMLTITTNDDFADVNLRYLIQLKEAEAWMFGTMVRGVFCDYLAELRKSQKGTMAQAILLTMLQLCDLC